MVHISFKKCLACGTPVTRNRKYCDKPACKKAGHAARQAAYRANRADTGTEPSPTDSDAPTGFVAPWGKVYKSIDYAWGDVLLSGGIDPDVDLDGETQAEWLAMMCEAHREWVSSGVVLS
jgi:hypothetical protein